MNPGKTTMSLFYRPIHAIRQRLSSLASRLLIAASILLPPIANALPVLAEQSTQGFKFGLTLNGSLTDTLKIDAQSTWMRQPPAYGFTLAGPAPSYALGVETATVATLKTTYPHNKLHEGLAYVYQGHFGGSVAFFNQNRSLAPQEPGTRGAIYELFWTPSQNIRVGAQYTAYNKFSSADSNSDAYGLNLKESNTWFGYIWITY